MLVPGRVGGFLLYEHIGEGEMGEIYRATDESLNRDVAIKLVRGCHSDDPGSLERLRQEACAAGKLNHPRVAQVYALNFSNDFPYLVMELVTGQDFAQKLKREGHIDERTVLRMALDVSEGLSALNREGLVHGDIKPGNIVLDRDGNAKLVDFGLSGMTRRDSTGALVGTPDYIAPELLRGAKDTHLSDLFSLGATLYHLLSGKLPHDGETMDAFLKARMYKPPVPIEKHVPHISFLTRKLIMRMLEPTPSKRPANSDAVAAEIRNALARLDAPQPETHSFMERLRRVLTRLQPDFPRRIPQATAAPSGAPSPAYGRRILAATASLLVFVGLGAGILVFLLAPQHPDLVQRAERLGKEIAGQIRTQAARFTPPKRPPAVATPHPAVTNRPITAPVRPPATMPPARQVPMPAPAAETNAVPDVFTAEVRPSWQSTNLSENAQSGSTMQKGGTLTIQGTGTDMWRGYDRCRFVWTRIAGNYAFSAQVRTIADNDDLAITGLMVKGPDPTIGPGLLFGFLGNGYLFLQIRQQNKTLVVKSSGRPIHIPCHLKLVRQGRMFKAYTSFDGNTWTPFASSELELPAENTLGFVVSAQVPSTLATATFTGIHLMK